MSADDVHDHDALVLIVEQLRFIDVRIEDHPPLLRGAEPAGGAAPAGSRGSPGSPRPLLRKSRVRMGTGGDSGALSTGTREGASARGGLQSLSLQRKVACFTHACRRCLLGQRYEGITAMEALV